MKKVLKSGDFLLAALLVCVISGFSLFAYSKADAACKAAKSTCQELNSQTQSDMFWDIFPRRLVSVLFH